MAMDGAHQEPAARMTLGLGEIWENAVVEYAAKVRGTGVDDKKKMQAISEYFANDLDKFIEEQRTKFDTARGGDKTSRKIGDAFAKFVGVVAKVCPVAGDGAGIVFPAAPVIGTVVAHLLGSFAKVKAQLDLMDDLLKTFTRFFDRLSCLDGRMIPGGKYTEMVANTFKSILQFCMCLEKKSQDKLFKHKTWFKAVFNKEDHELSEAHADVVLSIECVEAATYMETLAEVYKSNDLIERLQSTEESYHKESIRYQKESANNDTILLKYVRHIARYTTPGSQSSDPGARALKNQAIITHSLNQKAEQFRKRFRDIQEAFVDGTLRWILEEDSYKMLLEWARKQNDEPPAEPNQILYIVGEASTGKSTASVFVYKSLLDEFLPLEHVHVALFTFDREMDELRSFQNALACCSSQISQCDTEYGGNLKAVILNNSGNWKENCWRSFFLDQFKATTGEEGAEGENKVVAKKLILVLDGADQLAEMERQKLFEAVNETRSRDTQILFVLSSTRDPELAGFPSEGFQVRSIKLTDKEKFKDGIKRVARVRLEAIPHLFRGEKLISSIVTEVGEKADSFEYIDYTIRRLGSTNSTRLIKRTLNELPNSSNDFRNTLLEGYSSLYDEDEKANLGDLFAWLAYAEGNTTLDLAQAFLEGILHCNLNIETEILHRLSQVLTLSDDLNDPVEVSANAGIVVRFRDQNWRHHFTLGQLSENDRFRFPKGIAPIVVLARATKILTSAEGDPIEPKLVKQAAKTWKALLHRVDKDIAVTKLEKEVAEKLGISRLEDLMGNKEALRHLQDLTRSTVYDDAEKAFCSIFGSTPPEAMAGLANMVALVGKFGHQSEPVDRGLILRSVSQRHAENWWDCDHPNVAFVSFKHAYQADSFIAYQEAQPATQEYTGTTTATEMKKVPNHTSEDLERLAEKYSGDWKTEEWKCRGKIAMALSFTGRFPEALEQLKKGLQALEKSSESMPESQFVRAKFKFDFEFRAARALYAIWEEHAGTPKIKSNTVLKGFKKALKVAKLLENPKDEATIHSLNTAHQMSAMVRTYDRKWNKALKSMRNAPWCPSERFDFSIRFFNEMVATLGENGKWNEIMKLLEILDSANQNPLSDELWDETHCLVARAAVHLRRQEFVMKMYDESIGNAEGTGNDESTGNNEDTGNDDDPSNNDEVEFDGQASRWISKAWFERLAYNRPVKEVGTIKKMLYHALMTKSGSLEHITTAAFRLADIITDEFSQFPGLDKKMAALSELEGVQKGLKERLGFEFQLDRSSTSIHLALMRRKIGPALDFQKGLQATFTACLEMLGDDQPSNDTEALRLLAKTLMFLPGMEHRARTALSCQQYIITPTEIAAATADDTMASTALPVDRIPIESSDIHAISPSDIRAMFITTAEVVQEEPRLDEESKLTCSLCTKFCTISEDEPLYFCCYCSNVDLCSGCHDIRQCLTKPDVKCKDLEEQAYVEICAKGHKYIKVPADGWKGFRDGKLIIEGEDDIEFGSWLTKVKGEWNKAWEEYWLENPAWKL